MLAKFSKILTFFLFISFLLTACWDSRDIQDKEILTAVITDYDNDTYSFLVEIANIRGSKKSNSSGSNNNTFSIVRSEGSSLPAARFNLDRKTDCPVFLGATRALVITDRLARHGIEEYINRVRGTPDYRKTIDVVTTTTSPEAILGNEPENDISPGFAIEDTLRALENNGLGIHMSVGDILQAIAVKKVGFILPQINLQKDETTITGYSVFKNSKVVGYINAEESKGLLYLLSPQARFIYDVKYKGNKLTIEVSLKKRKIIPLYEQKNIKFKISMEFQGNILYMSKLAPIDDQLKNKYSEVLKNLIYKDVLHILAKSQKEFKCDYMEFYKYFRISYPQAFKSIDWNEAYSDAAMEIDIKSPIKPAGMFEINPQTNE